MADNQADLSPEERAQRTAELKAKMQAAAQKAKAAAENPAKAAATQVAAPAAADQRAAAIESPAAAVAAPEPAHDAAAGAAPAVKTNGSAHNGAAAAAELAISETLVMPPPVIEVETPEQRARKEMNRREFLTYTWMAGLGLLVLESGLLTYFFMYPRFKAGEFGGKFVVGPESSLPAADAPPQPNTAGKFWLVTTKDEGPKALYMVCTHLGCLYKWAQSNNRFECPCHGSKFSHDGFYIEGPAPRSLDHFVVTTENGTVSVDTGKKILGKPSTESPARGQKA